MNSKKVVIKKSNNPKKKYMAIFMKMANALKQLILDAGMSDYTKHKDKKIKIYQSTQIK